jgi:hypothetical protein
MNQVVATLEAFLAVEKETIGERKLIVKTGESVDFFLKMFPKRETLF